MKLVAILEAAYPRQELREETIEVYASFLLDIDYKVAEKAIQAHIRSERWFPTIAEIREACVEQVYKIPTTEQAMSIIREAVRTNNYKLISQNEILKQAVATVGFEKIGYSEYPEPLYNQVKEAYEELRKLQIKKLKNTPAIGMLGITREKPKIAVGG